MVLKMKTDIEIAQETVLEPVVSVAERMGIQADDLELYGKYKAKISEEYLHGIDGPARAIPRPMLRHQRRCGGRRLFAGRSDGRSESALYGGFSCGHVCK